MPKTQRTVSEAVCDRCKREGDTSQERGRADFGETNLQYSGFTGGYTWQGDSGGCSHKGTKWLCLACTRQFLDFMDGKATPPASPSTGEPQP